jgi:DHA2 family multidrug resistance protein
MVLTTPLVGWMLDRMDGRVPMLIGLAIYGICCYMMMLADLRIGFVYIMWAYIWRGLGLGFLYPPVYSVAIQGVPLEQTRGGSSLLNLQVTLGGAFSVSLLTTLIDTQQTVYQARFAETQLLSAVGTQHALTAFEQIANAAGVGASYLQGYMLGLLHGVVRREALVHALNHGFYVVALVGFCAVAIILTMWTTRQR